jgi:hypothetical protein
LQIAESTGRRAEKKAPDPAPPSPIMTGFVENHALRHGIEAPDPPLLLPVVIEMLAIGVVLEQRQRRLPSLASAMNISYLSG